jgi:hypothetical protein
LVVDLEDVTLLRYGTVRYNYLRYRDDESL